MTRVTIDDAKQICSDALAQAKKLGATASEAYFTVDNGLSVCARQGEVETMEYHQDQSLTVEVYVDHRAGSAVTTNLQPDAISAAIQKAFSIAQYTEEDPCNGLADKALIATTVPDCDLYHPWDITPEQAIDIVIACEQHAFAQDDRITNSDGITLDTNEYYRYYANSHGFGNGYRSTIHQLSCSLIAEENNLMQRDYDYTQARDATMLSEFDVVAETAAAKTLRRLMQPRAIKTCQAPVLFEPNLAKGLIGSLLSAVYGSSQYRKATYLLDSLGKPVSSSHLTIQQRPHVQKAYGSCPFDDEGILTRDIDFIKDGILQSYVLSSYSARKLGLTSTGNSGGVYNVLVKSKQTQPAKEIIKEMGTGFIVTELIGQGVNSVTGDYSRGAVGFWVENGEIQHAVEGVTIAGNLKDMLKNIIAVGDDTDFRSNIKIGSLLIESMTIAGI